MNPNLGVDRLCGRLTKNGSPCRQRLSNPRFDVACRQHASERERELSAAGSEAYWQGWRDGEESARDDTKSEVERLERRVAELKEATKPPRRMHDELGRQIVQVGRHAYVWDGTDVLAVGDEVWVPENWVSQLREGPGDYPGVVTELGTHYDGPLTVMRRRRS